MLPKDINNITEPVYKRLKKDIDAVKESSSAVIEASNITALSDDELNALKVGDVVQKITGEQKHCYIVSYKQEEHGICLTYVDAGYMETVSYDYIDGHWVYNSTDVVNINDIEGLPEYSRNDLNKILQIYTYHGTEIKAQWMTLNKGTSLRKYTLTATSGKLVVYSWQNPLPSYGTTVNEFLSGYFEYNDTLKRIPLIPEAMKDYLLLKEYALLTYPGGRFACSRYTRKFNFDSEGVVTFTDTYTGIKDGINASDFSSEAL